MSSWHISTKRPRWLSVWASLGLGQTTNNNKSSSCQNQQRLRSCTRLGDHSIGLRKYSHSHHPVTSSGQSQCSPSTVTCLYFTANQACNAPRLRLNYLSLGVTNQMLQESPKTQTIPRSSLILSIWEGCSLTSVNSGPYYMN